MAFPDWADRALVFTDKGVVGRREFTGKVNAITWDGFDPSDEESVRIRKYDGPPCDVFPPKNDGTNGDLGDPLVVEAIFGLFCPCAVWTCRSPDTPGLDQRGTRVLQWHFNLSGAIKLVRTSIHPTRP